MTITTKNTLTMLLGKRQMTTGERWTLRRLADVAGAVAEILRAAAAASRQQHEHPNQAQRVRVEDVPVDFAGAGDDDRCASDPVDSAGDSGEPAGGNS